MAKTKKATEKKSEVMAVTKRITRKTAKEARPSLTVPVAQPKKQVTSTGTTSKAKAKDKEKNPPPPPKAPKAPKVSKKQPKVAAAARNTNQTNSKTRNSQHGDLLQSMKPVSVQLRRIFTKSGKLPKNLMTSIIQQDWVNYTTNVPPPTVNNALKGIEFHPYQALQLHAKKGITYAMYNTQPKDNVRNGVIIIEAGKEKPLQKSGQQIRFTVLCGKANLVTKGICEHYQSGSVFTIPSNVRYAIKNLSEHPCYLNFFSFGGKSKNQ